MKNLLNWVYKLLSSNELYVRIDYHNEYSDVEIRGLPAYADREVIYFCLLENYFAQFSNVDKVSVSEFIDEGQGWRNTREKIADLAEEFSLCSRFSHEFDSPEPILPDEKLFIVHLTGILNMNWIKQVLAYSGTNLSNIIYGIMPNQNPDIETIIRWNKMFKDWYFLNPTVKDLSNVIKEVAFLSFGSDGSLDMLFTDNAKLAQMLNFLKQIGSENKWALDIEERVIK